MQTMAEEITAALGGLSLEGEVLSLEKIAEGLAKGTFKNVMVMAGAGPPLLPSFLRCAFLVCR